MGGHGNPAGQGSRHDPGRLPAAQPDARPGGRRGEVRPAGRDPELIQRRRMGRDRGGRQRRRARRAAGVTGAAGESQVRRAGPLRARRPPRSPVIDECHALSDWGHDFRPDYRRLAGVLQTLNPRTPVLATTATANDRVTRDVAVQLGEAAVVLRGQLARTSLQLVVVPPTDPLTRYAWVVDHLGVLPGSGIVYCLTVADAERLTTLLADRYGAEAVAVYTGQSRRRYPRSDRGPAAPQRPQGSGVHVRAGHGLRQARSRVRGPCGRHTLARRLLPADRACRPWAGPCSRRTPAQPGR